MPEGYEFTESINGVVSVRRIDRHGPHIPEQDVEIVRVEMVRHGQLRHHRAECVRGEIVIFEPSSGLMTLGAEHVIGSVSNGMSLRPTIWPPVPGTHRFRSLCPAAPVITPCIG